MKDKQPFHNSRYQQREKRRKTNLILNSLIGIVLLLIVLVSIQIFGNDEQTSTAEEQAQVESIATEEEKKSSDADNEAEKEKSTAKKESEDEKEKKDNVKDEEEKNKDENKEDAEKDEEENSEDEEQVIVKEGGDASDVKRTIVNPGWEPIGTVQTGEHHNTYSGIDWDEMVQAISYATGIPESNMTIHFLGNNGPNKSVGTIQAKDTKQKYRVYIEWVDEKGWKPTLVEELAE